MSFAVLETTPSFGIFLIHLATLIDFSLFFPFVGLEQLLTRHVRTQLFQRVPTVRITKTAPFKLVSQGVTSPTATLAQ